MSIKPEEYEQLRAWSALFIEHAIPLPASLPPEAHPIACLDLMARKAPARARQGLAMMIGDQMEMSDGLASFQIANLDAIFGEAGLPTRSDMRLRFQRQIKRVLKAGSIKSEVEYYAVRNAVEGVSDEDERQRLWDLLAAFENKVVASSK